MKKYILGIDEGTTSCRTVLYDVTKNEIDDISSRTFKSCYPKSGWVEQNASIIWQKQLETLKEIISKVNEDEIIGLGITNQRETVVAFNKKTGKPIYNAIVWQCRRTADDIEKIPQKFKDKIKQKTGLIPDAYFSATKIKWILNNVPEAKTLVSEGNLCVGTMDAYLSYKLTGKFVTDTTNASRTMLYNINTLQWDKELLEYFEVPKEILPEVVSSSEIIGKVLKYDFPLASIIGDQQSSLVGQGCVEEGMAKATYGTGGFILFNTGGERHNIKDVLTTVAYTVNGKTNYALEGSIYSASSTVNFMQEKLGFFFNPAETENMAKSVSDTNGVYFVPAFTGLGAPYWNSDVRGAIVGLNFDVGKSHIVRAGLESMAYNTRAIFQCMQKGGIDVNVLSVDGGCSKNKFLLQFLSDMLNKKVVKNKESEATAMGAIFLAGVATRTFTLKKIKSLNAKSLSYKPKMQKEVADELYKGWTKAVEMLTGEKIK